MGHPGLASRVITRAFVYTLVISISGFTELPTAFAEVDSVINSTISQGETASAKPDVNDICEAFDNAVAGKFVNSKNEELMTIDADCASKYKYRTDQAKNCSKKMSVVISAATKGSNNVDALCAGSNGTPSPSIQSYCSLRSIAKSSQALQYCEAYRAAEKAEKGLNRTLFFDIAAAGTCYAEYAAIKFAAASGGTFKGFACGGAAMAASLFELTQTASIIGKGKHSAGGLQVDSSNNVVERGATMKALEITASTGLSAAGFMIGLCYYNKDRDGGLCKKFSAVGGGKERMTKRGDAIIKAHEKKEAKLGAEAEVTDDFQNRSSAQIANQELALRAGITFTALAAMRGIAYSSAETTKKKAGDILQSMFDPSNMNSSLGSPGLATTSLPNLFTATAAQYNNVPATGGPTKTAATAAGNENSFLAPPGGPLAAKTLETASKMGPGPSAGSVASGEGLGNAVAGAAMAAGARDAAALNEIRSNASSIFANLPKEAGGYGSGGGGKGLASHKESGAGDLNLKGLFGNDGEKAMEAAGRTDVAFRGPAAEEDIWHSQNPKGNNLFQIVSDKYDNAQRKSVVGPGL